jgi:MOSC domain-containing protein YiiM
MAAARVVSIFIGPEPQQPMREVSEVEAVAGAGLVGDRYFQGGVPEDERDPTDEVTLIASEGIAAAASESGLDISPADIRRNIVTSGVEPSELLGKRFWIGEVELEGLEDNPPCAHLQRLAGMPLLKPMMGRAGIRARILTGGSIRSGDPLRIV